MKKYSIYGFVGIVFGVLTLLTTSAEMVFAGMQRDHSPVILRYHGGSYKYMSPYASGHKHKNYDRYGRKLGYVRSHKHDHDYEHYGFVRRLPHGSKKIKFEDVVYRYQGGHFYKKCNKHGYDIVPAPVGAIVRRLPYRANTNYRKGKKYYHYEGAYYKKVRNGFKVIEEPEFQITYFDDGYHTHYSSSKLRRNCY